MNSEGRNPHKSNGRAVIMFCLQPPPPLISGCLLSYDVNLALWVWRLLVQNITRINYHLWILVVAKSMFHLKIPDIVIFVRPFDVSTAEVPQQPPTTHKTE